MPLSGRWLATAPVAVALAVEYIDELVDGTKGAALPLIRGGLHLTYGQLGLLIAVPLLAGGLLELPFGLVARHGRRRHLVVLAGGLLMMASLSAVAAARSFAMLLAALVAFFPASGAFVGLTQAALMDAAPGRRQRRMAQWNLAGSAGAVCGPLMLAALLTVGGTWRLGFLLIAIGTGVALLAATVAGPSRAVSGVTGPGAVAGVAESSAVGRAGDSEHGGVVGRAGDSEHGGAVGRAGDSDHEVAVSEETERRPTVRAVLASLRNGEVAWWLVLLQISDLLLDVLTGYIAVYLVDVAHASPAQAALGVAVRLGAGLAGDALFVALSGRVGGRTVLRVSALAACLLYPAFLLVPDLSAKLVILAALSVATACWYPVLQAGLYDSLPGSSGIALFLSSAAGMAGAAGPLAVGFVAQSVGLTSALGCLAFAPVMILGFAAARRRPGR